MEIAIKDVSLHLLTEERRVEIKVTTETGETIIFPFAQVETRTSSSISSPSEMKKTLYAFAQKTEHIPARRVLTFFLEEEEGCPSRHKLEESSY